jgi:hypothetical protein
MAHVPATGIVGFSYATGQHGRHSDFCFEADTTRSDSGAAMAAARDGAAVSEAEILTGADRTGGTGQQAALQDRA